MEDFRDTEALTERLHRLVQNRIRLRGVANEFLANSEYSAAHEVLQSLLKITQEGDARMDVLLQLASCDVMTDKKINKATNDAITSLLHSNRTTCYEMREMAELKNEVQTIVAYFYSCRLSQNEPNARAALKNTEFCITTAGACIDKMVKAGLRSKAYKACHLLILMYEDMRHISTDDAELDAASIGECAVKIGYTLNTVGKNAEAAKVMKDGRERMEALIGDSVVTYHNYATMAHNISAALLKENSYQEAIAYTRKAIEEIQLAEDIDANKKADWLEEFRGNLETEVSNFSWKESRGRTDDLAGHQDYIREQSRMKGRPRNPGGRKNDNLWDNRQRGHQSGEANTEFDIMVDTAAQEVLKRGRIGGDTVEKISAHIEANEISWKDLNRMAENRSGAAGVILHVFTCKMLVFTESPEKVLREIGECFRRSRSDKTIDETVQWSF